MNDDSQSPRTRFRQPVNGWLLSVVMVPILYVLTWPPMEILCAKVILRTPASFTITLPPPSYGSATTGEFEGWVNISSPIYYPKQAWVIRMLYRPLHQGCRAFDERNVLYYYWEWWCDRLGEDSSILKCGDD